jgi:hypothetical protein
MPSPLPSFENKSVRAGHFRPASVVAAVVPAPVAAPLAVALAAALTIAVAAGVIVPSWIHRVPRLDRAALWGFVLLTSFAGWGGLVARIAFPGRAPDLGLRLVWGAAANLAAGGLLCLLSVATSAVLSTMVVGGAVLLLIETWAWARGRPVAFPAVASGRWPAGVLVALSALGVLAIVQYLAGAAALDLQYNDDYAAYLVFPKKILATGTLIEPFALRRMSAQGGQSFLQALVLIGSANPMQVPLFDLGISLLLVIALILGAADGKTPRAVWTLPVLLAVTVPDIRINSGSEMSGVIFFLGLVRTVTWTGALERPRARAVVLALLAVAACTLRQSYLVTAAMFLAILYAPALIAAVRTRAPAAWAEVKVAATAAAAFVLFVAPWALLAFRSNRTFLFPLANGNYRPEYGHMVRNSELLSRIKFFWLNICHCHPVYSLPLFLLAGLLIPWRATGGALPALLGAGALGFASIVYSFPLSDQVNIARYYFAFDLACVLAILMAGLSWYWTAPRADRARALIPAALVIAALAIQVQESHGAIQSDYNKMFDAINAALRRKSSIAERDGRYVELQATIPAGAPVLVMLDEPFWMDFRRNPVLLVDLPGAASPAPGMPLDEDEAMVRYLEAQGLRYLAFVRATKSASLYQRGSWEQAAKTGAPIWKAAAPFYVRMFDRCDSLLKSRRVLYDDGEMVVLDLEARS